jgi:hypothetical protein
MNRILASVALALCSFLPSPVLAQTPAPQAYTLEATGELFDRPMAVTIERDGSRERVVTTLGPSRTTSLFDFAEHKVYWIGWSGADSCSSGRYLSERAPVSYDPVTGTPETLAKLTEGGRSRKPAGTATVAGRAARIEALAGGKRPTGPDAEPWPTRIWLGEEGGYLLKLEAEGARGKLVTPYEVKRLDFGKPRGAPLDPPAGCMATNSEMDDSGSIRGGATASIGAEVSGEAALGGAPAVAPAAPAKPRPLAKIEALVLEVIPLPDDGPCPTKLAVRGSLSVDGPAMVKVILRSSVGGVKFPAGETTTVTVEGAGSATIEREAKLLRALKGTMRLQAMVLGEKGHDGPMKSSVAVPFDVTCAK